VQVFVQNQLSETKYTPYNQKKQAPFSRGLGAIWLLLFERLRQAGAPLSYENMDLKENSRNHAALNAVQGAEYFLKYE
jgi:hypothetical protein